MMKTEVLYSSLEHARFYHKMLDVFVQGHISPCARL